MAVELVRATPEHAPEVARILFDAFGALHDRHAVHRDFISREMAVSVAGMLTARPDYYGVVAIEGGRVIGSNFLALSDAVAAVGPITVDPAIQTKGIGRRLMQDVIDWGRANHGPMIRLVQEAINMASLSLYMSQGFDVVEPLLLTAIAPAREADETVRALTPADVAAGDVLCRRIQKVSRKNELAIMIEHGKEMGFVPFGRFGNGRLTAYLIPGFIGHGVGETVDDLLTTAEQAARQLPPHTHQIVLPTRNSELFRGALKRGFRGVKSWNLMAMGPYEAPEGVWTPSVGY